jgi:poly-gamma-glutamate capsule biosynthesis protein CapA/YwtB (metallophosphatase superfamily)
MPITSLSASIVLAAALVSPEPRHGLTITAVGDVRMSAEQIAAHESQLRKLHLKGDLVFANFEGAIGDPVVSDPWKFAVPIKAAGILRGVGVNVVSLANNHALDLGGEALRATASALGAEGIRPIDNDSATDAAEFAHHRIRIYAFSFSSTRQNVNDLDSIPRRFAANPGEIVIVSAHMGGENHEGQRIAPGTEYFGDEPRGDVIAFSRRCIDAGADLVLGHGPHVPRGLELYKGKLVVYSLGNFAFDYPGVSFHPHAPGYSISIRLDAQGNFRSARIHSYDLRHGAPVPDRSAKAYRMIRELTLRNLKQSNLAFPGNGRVELAKYLTIRRGEHLSQPMSD